jgi:hypothetical protein
MNFRTLRDSILLVVVYPMEYIIVVCVGTEILGNHFFEVYSTCPCSLPTDTIHDKKRKRLSEAKSDAEEF